MSMVSGIYFIELWQVLVGACRHIEVFICDLNILKDNKW